MAAMGDDMVDEEGVLDLTTTHARSADLDFWSRSELPTAKSSAQAEEALPFKKRRLYHLQTGSLSLPLRAESSDVTGGGHVTWHDLASVDSSETDSVKDLTLNLAAMKTDRPGTPHLLVTMEPIPRDWDEVKDTVESRITDLRIDEADAVAGRGLVTSRSLSHWRSPDKETKLNRNGPPTHEYAECISEDIDLSEEEIKYMQQADEDGDLPLHLAAVQENVDMVLKFTHVMNKMNISLDQTNALNQTPLHLATLTKNKTIVQILLSAGASPNVPNKKGNNCCHLAAKHNAVECLEVILSHSKEKVDMDAQNYEGMTALHYAAKEGFLTCIRMLVDYGAEINTVDGKSGKTALYMAFECNQSTSATLLLCLGADVNIPTYSGCTLIQAVNSHGEKLLSENNVSLTQTRSRKHPKCRQKPQKAHTVPL